jgi:hypothetical protein
MSVMRVREPGSAHDRAFAVAERLNDSPGESTRVDLELARHGDRPRREVFAAL